MLTQMPAQRRTSPPPIVLERTRPDARGAGLTIVGPAVGAAPASRLIVTAGPQPIGELALLDAPVAIGRAPQSDFAVADPSVSRRHCRLEKRDGRWVVLDQGSGNGTLVNGVAVCSRVLRHGDEIAIGDTRLRFLEPGGVVAWNDRRGRAPSLRKTCMQAAAVTSAAIVAAACVVRDARARIAVDAGVRAAAIRSAARAQLEQGLALARQGRWGEARHRLAVAAELDPADEEIARSLELARSTESGASALPSPAGLPGSARPSEPARRSETPRGEEAGP